MYSSERLAFKLFPVVTESSEFHYQYGRMDGKAYVINPKTMKYML